LSPPPPSSTLFPYTTLFRSSKAGCNLGPCHGNKNGKGGLQLSLRGEWPDADYRTLTREVHSRRIDRVSPEQSLILKKPTMQVAQDRKSTRLNSSHVKISYAV